MTSAASSYDSPWMAQSTKTSRSLTESVPTTSRTRPSSSFWSARLSGPSWGAVAGSMTPSDVVARAAAQRDGRQLLESQEVDAGVTCHGVDPGQEPSPRIEGLRVPVDLQEHFLSQVVRPVPIAHEPLDEPADARSMPLVQAPRKPPRSPFMRRTMSASSDSMPAELVSLKLSRLSSTMDSLGPAGLEAPWHLCTKAAPCRSLGLWPPEQPMPAPHVRFGKPWNEAENRRIPASPRSALAAGTGWSQRDPPRAPLPASPDRRLGDGLRGRIPPPVAAGWAPRSWPAPPSRQSSSGRI